GIDAGGRGHRSDLRRQGGAAGVGMPGDAAFRRAVRSGTGFGPCLIVNADKKSRDDFRRTLYHRRVFTTGRWIERTASRSAKELRWLTLLMLVFCGTRLVLVPASAQSTSVPATIDGVEGVYQSRVEVQNTARAWDFNAEIYGDHLAVGIPNLPAGPLTME